MGKDAPVAKDAPARKPEVETAGDNGNHGIQGAVNDAWGGFKGFMRKAGETAREVGGTVVEKGGEMVHKGKEFVRSEQGQEMIRKTREGAADAVDAAGGHGKNAQVNEVVRRARIIPGAGNVLNAAETLSESGVTRVMRDGKGKINQDRLIRGAVESAPVSGDAARVKSLADQTGVTGRVVDAVRERVQATQQSDGAAGKKPQDKERAHEEQPRERVRR